LARGRLRNRTTNPKFALRRTRRMSTTILRMRHAFITFATSGVVVAFLSGCSGSDEARPTAAPSPLDSIVPSPLSNVPDFGAAAAPVEAPPSTPAPDPAEAVQSYLSGEVDGDFERSYAALSTASRENVGSVADWAETAFQRPTIVSYEIDPPTSVPPAGASAVIVTGEVRLEPRLDEVSGFVPHRAAVEWKVVAEDGGWRLDLVDSSLDPILPDEQGATAAAERWANARQQCRTDGEYEGSLLGSPALGDQLCGLQGDLVAGPPAALDEAITSQVVAAFGPDALSWARSVALSGASELSVVTAPFGDHWVVVGVAG
jgi:hypothetical protein